nr:hypothetical protein [Tanacetum cinerariifolium]
MTGNISYLSEYEPYDGGYVSFGHGGGKITGKGIIKADLKLKNDTNVLLRTHRQHNMYSIDLNNIVPHKNLTCLVAKASVDESMLWHRRLGHLNFKTMNKLVRYNLVKGLPSKCFKNDHTCVACLKRKQHKASCKTKLVNSVSKPLHTLHMDLFGPTSVSRLNHKWYCLVVTDDLFRFTWTFFLRTKDETSSILRNFITEIENLKDLKQNRVAERRNRTLIKAARIMLADAKLPVTFWTEAVNTACYFQNRVLVNKSQNKTPYKLFNSRTPAIGFLRPFGCHVMILNTLDHLGKFDAKGDKGYFVGYSMSSKAFRKDVSSLRYIALPNWFHKAYMETSNSDAPEGCNDDVSESSGISNPTATSKVPLAKQVEPAVSLTVETEIPTVISHVPTVCLDISSESSSDLKLITKGDFSQKETPSLGNAEEPKKIFDALKDPSWVEAMQEELLQFKIQNVWILVDCPKGMDVKSAFLYGTINEEVYVMQHLGFQDPKFPDRVYKVEKAMYGLYQAPRAWYGTLFKEFEALMHDKFQMSSMSELTFFLGLQVLQKKDGIFLSQDKYGKDGTGKDVELHLYRSMIRSLMYLIASRPDIMFIVCACARHQVTPKECHHHAIKRIFRYLKGHPKLGLSYPKESPFDLVAYSDSDYGSATQDRKSTT